MWNKYIDRDAWRSKYVAIILCIFLFYIALHHMLTAVIGSLTDSYPVIKVAKDGVIFFVFLLMMILTAKKRSLRKQFISDKLNVIILLFIALHIIMLIPIAGVDLKAGVAGLIFNLRFLTAFLIVRIFMMLSPIGIGVYKRRVVDVFLAIATIVSVFAITQVNLLPSDAMRSIGYDGVNTIAPISTVDDDENMLRAFSTMRGPNELGSYLILPICIAIVMLIRYRHKIYLIAAILMIVALYLTYSRSALISCLIAVVLIISVKYRVSLSRHLKLSILLVVAGFIIVAAGLTFPSVRMIVFHSSSTDSSLLEGSTGDHFVAIEKGVKDSMEHPFGRGVGQAGPASFYSAGKTPRIAENYFIQIAQEIGIIGMLIFISICWMVFVRLLRLKGELPLALGASLLGLSVNALFLHTWSDEAVAYTWWILAALFIAPTSSGLSLGIIERVRKRIYEFTDRT